jgi:hemerythrin superfamily protein
MDVLDTVKSVMGVDTRRDVRGLLKDDHKDILDLARRLADEGSTAQRRALFKALKPLLTAHARAEERAVYSELVKARSTRDSKDLGNEGFVEHSLVDVLLERMSKTALAGSDAWKAHATVLKELLEHHIKEEEGEIFDELGEHFSDERREAMAEAFLEDKRAILEPRSRGARKAA